MSSLGVSVTPGNVTGLDSPGSLSMGQLAALIELYQSTLSTFVPGRCFKPHCTHVNLSALSSLLDVLVLGTWFMTALYGMATLQVRSQCSALFVRLCS